MLDGTIRSITFLGLIMSVHVLIGEHIFFTDTFNNPYLEPPKIGKQVQIMCSREAALVLDEEYDIFSSTVRATGSLV